MAAHDDRPLVAWRSSPAHERGTYDIISLCASTLVICAWSAVHVDVPKRRTFRATHGARIFWFFIGIFMPELLLTFAVGQFMQAHRISSYAYDKRGFERPPPWWRQLLLSVSLCSGKKDRDENQDNNVLLDDLRSEIDVPVTEPGVSTSRKHAWTLTHSFYALMGGIPDANPERQFVNWDWDTLEKSTDVSVAEILDRSKAGPIAKALLCVQIVFFCANCAARINQSLPLSLLEITTIAHCLCALGAYAVWWNKPQDIGGEVSLRTEVSTMRYLVDAVMGHYSDDHVGTSAFRSLILATIPISVLYGCPHLLGLHIRFATSAEHILWLLSTTLAISCPILAVIALHCMVKTGELGWDIVSDFCMTSVMLLIFMYPFASAFLVCESIRQVFALPEASFAQPQWTQYIPHFS